MRCAQRPAFLCLAIALAAPSAFGQASDPMQREAANATAVIPDEKQRQESGRISVLPEGLSSKPVVDANAITEPLATATEAALTRDGFDDLVERLVEQDRNRIARDGFTAKRFEDLNRRAESISRAWRARYGSDFNIDDTGSVFHNKFAIAQAEVVDPQAVAAHWPVAAETVAQTASFRGSSARVEINSADGVNIGENQHGARPDAGDARTPVDQRNDPLEKRHDQTQPQRDGLNLREKAIERAQLDRGRNVAIIAFPPSGDVESPLHVSLINEAVMFWRIDVPNDMTGERLHENLLKQLTYLDENPTAWPDDQNEAKAFIARHVMMALYDIDASEPTAQPANFRMEADKPQDATQ